MKIILLILSLVAIISCDKGAKTPEGLLQMYVKDLTSKSVTKDDYEKYTTGKLWERVADLDEEDFKKFIDLSRVKNPQMRITNKSCQASSCTITYILKYNVTDKDNAEFKSEVKKIAILEKFEDIWKIADVSNVKTFIDAKSSINIGPNN